VVVRVWCEVVSEVVAMEPESVWSKAKRFGVGIVAGKVGEAGAVEMMSVLQRIRARSARVGGSGGRGTGGWEIRMQSYCGDKRRAPTSRPTFEVGCSRERPHVTLSIMHTQVLFFSAWQTCRHDAFNASRRLNSVFCACHSPPMSI